MSAAECAYTQQPGSPTSASSVPLLAVALSEQQQRQIPFSCHLALFGAALIVQPSTPSRPTLLIFLFELPNH